MERDRKGRIKGGVRRKGNREKGRGMERKEGAGQEEAYVCVKRHSPRVCSLQLRN